MKRCLIIVTPFLFSCKPDTIRCDNNPNPCQNGGECLEGPWTSFLCDCPEGFCGDYCEVEAIYTLYGNYAGVFICQGDTIDKDFVVEEGDACDRGFLSLNRGEFTATYWKSGGPYTVGTTDPKILIDPRLSIEENFGSGRLTKDSLIFWMQTGTPQDTCFYVGSSN